MLGFLHSGPQTGWELATTVEASLGGFWNVTRSQIYRELQSLAASCLVTPGERGARDKRSYTLTAAGRAAFAEWIAREPGEEIIRFPLLLTTFFAEHVPPERLARFLLTHQLRHQKQMEAYEAIAHHIGGDESGPALALRFGIEYERAVLRWFDSLPQLHSKV